MVEAQVKTDLRCTVKNVNNWIFFPTETNSTRCIREARPFLEKNLYKNINLDK
jgi:hypothetical protein